MIMPAPFEIRNISVGDLLVQQIPDPIKLDKILRRRGIIVNVQNNISTIEWTIDGSEVPTSELTKTTILNMSLRKMIMDGYILHYPVQK